MSKTKLHVKPHPDNPYLLAIVDEQDNILLSVSRDCEFHPDALPNNLNSNYLIRGRKNFQGKYDYFSIYYFDGEKFTQILYVPGTEINLDSFIRRKTNLFVVEIDTKPIFYYIQKDKCIDILEKNNEELFSEGEIEYLFYPDINTLIFVGKNNLIEINKDKLFFHIKDGYLTDYGSGKKQGEVYLAYSTNSTKKLELFHIDKKIKKIFEYENKNSNYTIDICTSYNKCIPYFFIRKFINHEDYISQTEEMYFIDKKNNKIVKIPNFKEKFVTYSIHSYSKDKQNYYYMIGGKLKRNNDEELLWFLYRIKNNKVELISNPDGLDSININRFFPDNEFLNCYIARRNNYIMLIEPVTNKVLISVIYSYASEEFLEELFSYININKKLSYKEKGKIIFENLICTQNNF